jgi:hypothetical protein
MRTTSDYLAASVDAFVRLSRLTVVLSSVLDHFYTVSRNPGVMSPNEALSRASDCQAQLTRCLNELGLGPVLLRPSRTING